MKFMLPLLLCMSPALLRASEPEELQLSRSEAQTLGVTFSPADSVTTGIALQANATVVVPPSNEQSANSLYPGFISRLSVAVGDQVVRGQTLAEVSSVEFLELQRKLLSAQAELRISRNQLRRDETLATEGIIAQRRLEESRARSQIASMHVSELQQVLQLSGLDQLSLDTLLDEGRLQPLLPVVAPISGIVLESFGRTGDQVGALAPLYRLADLSMLWLDIRVDHAKARHLARGQTFQVVSPAGASGTITAIGSLVDPHTQTVTVRGVVDPSGVHALRPDQFVQVDIQLPPSGDADSAATTASVLATASVPRQALIRHQDGAFVFAQRDGRVLAVPVVVHSFGADSVNLTEGVRPGDMVAVTGIAALKALWLGGREEP